MHIIIGYSMTKTSNQGRPRKSDGGKVRIKHMREAWRKASKKYYDKKRAEKEKHGKKTKK
jgi:hypothetical protein